MRILLLAALLGLSGFVTRQQVLELPEFQDQYEKTVIDRAVLENLNATDVAVIVVFGDWCGDSVDHVPVFMKIQDVLPFADVQWVAVGRKLADDTGIVEAMGIERVPTFIFMRDGVEFGRIIETPKTTMEQDVAEILGGTTVE